jgi:hypothetical protein
MDITVCSVTTRMPQGPQIIHAEIKDTYGTRLLFFERYVRMICILCIRYAYASSYVQNYFQY